MLIIGHRGAAGLAPENTISSLQKAQECGADMIEMDVRRDSNGGIILAHDFVPGKNYPGAISLKRVLAKITAPVDLDIKEAGFEAELLEITKTFPHKVLITSWNPFVIKKIRTLDRNIPLGSVIGRKYGFFLPIVISFLKDLNISCISIDVALIDEKSMHEINQVGWKVYAFTNDDAKIFNDPKIYQRLKDLGVDGIITDYPNIVSQFKLL